MTWQDELRQLDEELASGGLSAEDYRRRRDELLSQGAAGRGPAQAGPGAGDQQAGAPQHAGARPGADPSGQHVAQPQGPGPQGQPGPGPQGVGAQGPAPQGVGAQGPGPQGVGAQGQPGPAPQGVGAQGPGPQGPAPQGVGPQGQQGPGPGQPGGNPFPPPFRWDQPTPAESTQVMRPVKDADGDKTQARPAGDAERTQVVPGAGAQTGGSTGGTGNGAGNGDADSTQVVPGSTPGMQGGRPPTFPPRPADGQLGRRGPGQHGGPQQGGGPQHGGFGQAVPPWQQTTDTTPPWASSDLPPQTDVPPVWLRQGPESFEKTDEGSGRTKALVLTAVGVVVLLALAVGAYFVFRPDSQSPVGQQTGTSVPSTTTSAAPTTPPGPPIAELPGASRDTSNVEAFADVEELQYLTPEEVAVYRTAGAGESKFALADDDGVQALVLIVQASTDAAAGEARDALAALQDSYRLTRATDAPTGVVSASFDGSQSGPLRRAHYASEDLIVRIEVQGQGTPDTIDRVFDEVLGAQLDVMPASSA